MFLNLHLGTIDTTTLLLIFPLSRFHFYLPCIMDGDVLELLCPGFPILGLDMRVVGLRHKVVETVQVESEKKLRINCCARGGGVIYA